LTLIAIAADFVHRRSQDNLRPVVLARRTLAALLFSRRLSARRHQKPFAIAADLSIDERKTVQRLSYLPAELLSLRFFPEKLSSIV